MRKYKVEIEVEIDETYDGGIPLSPTMASDVTNIEYEKEVIKDVLSISHTAQLLHHIEMHSSSNYPSYKKYLILSQDVSLQLKDKVKISLIK